MSPKENWSERQMSLGARSQGEEEGRCVIAGVASGQKGREIADPAEEGSGQSQRRDLVFVSKLSLFRALSSLFRHCICTV